MLIDPPSGSATVYVSLTSTGTGIPVKMASPVLVAGNQWSCGA